MNRPPADIAADIAAEETRRVIKRSMLALAFFTASIALRERIYRYLGLGVLAGALGRVVIIDVWKLEPLYRILSFMALGIVLLVLGFIYNKYQEKLKEWL